MKPMITLAGILLLLTYAGCAESAGEVPHELPHLAVTNPLREDANIVKDYVCQIRAIRHIELRALTRGYLEEVQVDEGQAVKTGQPMFKVMSQLYQAQLAKAQAEKETAEIEYLNTERLAKTNVVAPSELALAKAKLDKAKAALALDQVHLDFTQIKAPFDGIMGKLKVRRGSLVEDGDLLTTLSDNQDMWVYFNVPETEYLAFKRKGIQENQMEAKLVMADNSTYNHPGKITAVEADFNNETGNIAFRATFPNPEGLLRHGQTGKVLLNATIKDALSVPQASVFEILDKRFVLAVDDKGKVSSKEVKISAQMPDLFVISEGISSDDMILLEGQRKVNVGDYIVPKFEDAHQVVQKLKVYAE